MLTEADIERFDSIFNKVLQTREERGYTPARDEELIAEIISNAKKVADESEARGLELKKRFRTSARFQAPASTSDKELPQLSRYRNFDDVESL